MIDLGLEGEFSSGGFFSEARLMNFDKSKAEKILNLLESVNYSEIPEIDRIHIANKIWDLPLIVFWYKERCVSKGADDKEYEAIAARFFEVVRSAMNDLSSE